MTTWILFFSLLFYFLFMIFFSEKLAKLTNKKTISKNLTNSPKFSGYDFATYAIFN